MQPSTLEVIGAVLGSLGFTLSIVLAYVGHFRPSRISVLPGGRLQFYPAPARGPQGLVWGGTGFYLPLTFHNWSTRGGVVYTVRLLLQPVAKPEVCYDMKRQEFAELKEDRRWVSNRLAQPLPVDGQASRTEMVQFQWPHGGTLFFPEAGNWTVLILVWTRPGSRPQIVYKTSMTIPDIKSQGYIHCLQNEQALTFEVPLGDEGEWHHLSHQGESRRRYRL